MDKLDRIHGLHKLMQRRHTPVSLETIKAELECSDATARRTGADLRDCYGAPIAYDRKAGGWHYGQRDRSPLRTPRDSGSVPRSAMREPNLLTLLLLSWSSQVLIPMTGPIDKDPVFKGADEELAHLEGDAIRTQAKRASLSFVDKEHAAAIQKVRKHIAESLAAIDKLKRQREDPGALTDGTGTRRYQRGRQQFPGSRFEPPPLVG